MLHNIPHLFSSTLPISMESQNNPILYNHHPQPPSSAFSLNHNNNNSHEPEQIFINTKTTTTTTTTTTQHFTIEPMFHKTLTPSDVGKLNRLVIPKHHAEKYFPLDATHQPKAPFLSFDDESGKQWQFRYSYWNSSQSYVFTKGWSRYVKEKRLETGDVVFFERHRLDCERMFIGWRRRSAVEAVEVAQPVNGGGGEINGWRNMVFHDSESHYRSHHLPLSIPLPDQPECLHAGYARMVATRRLRLFGVNLECPDDDSEPQTPDGSSCGGQSDHQYVV